MQLKLTNKSIASDVGFGVLHTIFSDRYVEPLEYIDKHLERLQLKDLFELCNAYRPPPGTSPNYNLVLTHLKKQGFALKNISDKEDIKEKFEKIINSDRGAIETLNEAFDLELLKKSDSCSEYLEQKNRFDEELQLDDSFKKFRPLYLGGKTTFLRIKGDFPDIAEDDFDDLKRSVRKDKFYNELFSEGLKFKEIINYYRYLNEDTEYITMHKTKGGERENVLVVLDEYFWTKYDFGTVFSKQINTEKKRKSGKLVYVACSRAKTNLRCVRLASNEEEVDNLCEYFDTVVPVSSYEAKCN